jgi:hypothetical protein
MMDRIFGWAVVLALAIGLFGGLPILALSGLYSLKYGDCIRFPNGTEIGYEANIDFGNPYFRPDAVLRDPGGEMIAKEVDPIRVTEKATFGWAWPETTGDRQDFRFIWTHGFGLVREDQNPTLYQKLKGDLGDTYYGVRKDLNVNTLWLFTRLANDARFQSDKCNTPLVTW